MYMEWARFHKPDENGRHYFQTHSVPYAWAAATPKGPGAGWIGEAAALAYSIISAAGWQWQTPRHCVECTMTAKSTQRATAESAAMIRTAGALHPSDGDHDIPGCHTLINMV